MSGVFGGAGMLRRPGAGGPTRRFDEYYRCYPVAMLPGPERDNVNCGGKVIMPPSALDKLTRMHIVYPMMFELVNGAKERTSHAGVLEFIAEEGKIYVPFWVRMKPLSIDSTKVGYLKLTVCVVQLMQVLQLEPGDLLQVKSTDLPSGSFVKLQAQSTAFLDISDPKAVLEEVLRNYSCLTTGDVFTFAYNEQTFDMAVLETRPQADKRAISVVETDLEVDFAAPVGYEEPARTGPGAARPGTNMTRGTGKSLPSGGMVHSAGTMAQAINYAAIAPDAATAGGAAPSNFVGGGQKLSGRKTGKGATPQGASTPVGGAAAEPPATAPVRRGNGPQPLRLPPGKLFFGYPIKPVRKEGDGPAEEPKEPRFKGQGQTLRAGGKKRKDGGDT